MAFVSRSLWPASAAANRSASALHFGSVIALADMNDEIFPVLDLELDGMEEAIGLHRFEPVGNVVLMAQFVGDVLEGLLEIFHFEREESASAGFRGVILENLVPIRFDFGDVGGDRV